MEISKKYTYTDYKTVVRYCRRRELLIPDENLGGSGIGLDNERAWMLRIPLRIGKGAEPRILVHFTASANEITPG